MQKLIGLEMEMTTIVFSMPNLKQDTTPRTSIFQKEAEELITGQSNIVKEVMTFYGNLMGTTSTRINHIDVEAMRRGSLVDMEHRNWIIRKVTMQEIEEALKGI